MDWTGWWHLVSLIILVVGVGFIAKAYYDYCRDQTKGVHPGAALFGFLLAGIGLASLLAHLIYGRVGG